MHRNAAMGALIDKVKGKIKKLEGRLTGDKVRTAEGQVDDTKGDVKIGASVVADKVKLAAGKAKRKIQRAGTRAKRKSRRAAR